MSGTKPASQRYDIPFSPSFEGGTVECPVNGYRVFFGSVPHKKTAPHCAELSFLPSFLGKGRG